jgi:hypothetical protein
LAALVVAVLSGIVLTASAAPPSPASATTSDVAWDDGTALVIQWEAPTDPSIAGFRVYRALSPAEFAKALRDRRVNAAASAWERAMADESSGSTSRRERADAAATAAAQAVHDGDVEREVLAGIALASDRSFVVAPVETGVEMAFRVAAYGADGSESDRISAGSAAASAQWFMGSRGWLLPLLVGLCTIIIGCIMLARSGRPIKVRRIAGLDAIDEAVGRATEMGRPVLYIAGVQDMDNVQTVAGVTILGRVAKIAAEFDAKIEVPTARSLVMTAARDVVQSAYYEAGRPDAYNPDAIRYITDEQFGYVAYVAGRMVREKPATCIYMGQFYAESLLLSENGNAINAIQIAGTAESSQLPFFVAACDYTLIGEEFFAASAYLAGEPTQLGSLFGQDIAKLIAMAVILVGVVLATLGSLGSEMAENASDYLSQSVLAS